MKSPFEFDENQSIWRYMTASRFIELVESEELYFASAYQFSDPFEGAVAVMPPDYQEDPRYAGYGSTENAFKDLKRMTKINCWHIENYESDAMWKLYSGNDKGVAVVSNSKNLLSSLKPYRIKPSYGEETIKAGNVVYVDLLQERLEANMLDRFYFKHRAFSWENEFRLTISLRMATEFAVAIPNHGIKVNLDIETCINEIYLGPSIGLSDKRAVEKAWEQKGFESSRIKSSSLIGKPRYI